MDKLHQANVSVEELQSQLVTLTKERDTKTRFGYSYIGPCNDACMLCASGSTHCHIICIMV